MAVFVTIFLALGSVPFVVCGWQFWRGRWRELLAKYEPTEELGVRVPKDNELRVAAGLYLGTGALMTLPTVPDIWVRGALSGIPRPLEVLFGAIATASLLAALVGLLVLLVGHFRRKARERREGVPSAGAGDYDELRDDEESREYVREKMGEGR